MNLLSNYPEKFLLGRVNNENIYLAKPSWDCGWYWGFGYIGNSNCHYHLSGIGKENNKNLYDGLKEHFGNTLVLRESSLWKFCEIVSTIYKLKDTAEVFRVGGAHYTNNPCKELIIDKSIVEKINSTLIPQLIEEMYKVLLNNKNNEELFNRIEELFTEVDASKVVDFMKQNNITTDDLKGKINSKDFYTIHGYYWKDYHGNKDK